MTRLNQEKLALEMKETHERAVAEMRVAVELEWKVKYEKEKQQVRILCHLFLFCHLFELLQCWNYDVEVIVYRDSYVVVMYVYLIL